MKIPLLISFRTGGRSVPERAAGLCLVPVAMAELWTYGSQRTGQRWTG
ncbi:rCG62288 [Rattus norvegicus]|uniref:RCG62288 n=1 Tax=Rattus norvegicus TaxID=10116 RepID=A6HA42_RAT|nr:rCG62288 [Rattus norvegicus]